MSASCQLSFDMVQLSCARTTDIIERDAALENQLADLVSRRIGR